MDAMVAFTKGDPHAVYHLPRKRELLIEQPESIGIHRIVVDKQNLR